MSGHCEGCGEAVGPGVYRCTCPVPKNAKLHKAVLPVVLSDDVWVYNEPKQLTVVAYGKIINIPWRKIKRPGYTSTKD